MVVADLRGAHARYRLLETLRQFGEEQLAGTGELAVGRDRHLAYFAEVAFDAGRQVTGTRYAAGVAVLEAEWDNFRAALGWAVTTNDAARGSKLVETLRPFAVWQQRHELGDWAERVLHLYGAASVAYGVAADFASQRGDHERALLLARLGNAATRGPRDPGARICAEVAARAYWYSGQVAEGWAAVQTWDGMCDPTEEPFDAAWAALRLATFAFVVEPSSAAGHVDRARRIGSSLANPALDIHIIVVTGMVERAAGHYDAALAHFRQATDLAAETGNRYLEGLAIVSIGFLAPRTDAVDAQKALRDALMRLYASRNWLNLWAVMEALALHWARTGRKELAAVLLGHLDQHDIRHAVFVSRRQQALANLRGVVGAEAWFAHGAGLDRDELVLYALKELTDDSEPP
jgi:tetratricopeptide (TPR) repeat protein